MGSDKRLEVGWKGKPPRGKLVGIDGSSRSIEDGDAAISSAGRVHYSTFWKVLAKGTLVHSLPPHASAAALSGSIVLRLLDQGPLIRGGTHYDAFGVWG